jgi:hypothetical protein
MEATRTRLLTFMTTATSLAKPGTNAATNTTPFLLGAFGRLDGIQLHD